MLTGRAVDFECLKETTDICLATMLRIEGADVLVKLKLSMNASGLTNFSGTDFYGCKASVSVQDVSGYGAGLGSMSYLIFRQSQTVECAPYPSFPTTLYLDLKISPIRTG